VTVSVKLSQLPTVPACVSTHVDSPLPAGGDPVSVPSHEPPKGATDPAGETLPEAGFAARFTVGSMPMLMQSTTPMQIDLRNVFRNGFDLSRVLFIYLDLLLRALLIDKD